jgi:hypothetical protein
VSLLFLRFLGSLSHFLLIQINGAIINFWFFIFFGIFRVSCIHVGLSFFNAQFSETNSLFIISGLESDSDLFEGFVEIVGFGVRSTLFEQAF